jgi:hypothetical protein
MLKLFNGSFEFSTISPNSYLYASQPNFSAPGWTFSSSGSGLISPPSGFSAPTAEDGAQIAFLQMSNASFSQTVVLPTNGLYTLAYYVAGRPNAGNVTYSVWLDSSILITNATTVSGQAFTLQSISFTATNGSHVLLFTNSPNLVGDNTAFFDLVQINGGTNILGPSIPDLAITGVSWTGTPTAGQNLAVSLTVTNVGNGTANSSWNDAWVLSTNTTLQGAVSSVFQNGAGRLLPPGSGYTISYNNSYGGMLPLPNVPAGNYYLIGIANYGSNLWESGYANNALAIVITIGNTDLIATNFSANDTPVAGTNLSITFTVANIATNAYSSYWYDGVTLSTNATLAGAITKWDWYGYHSLASGGSYVQNQSILLPGIAAGTNYYLIAQADDRTNVPESDKSNNLQVMQITVTNRPPTIALLTPNNMFEQTSCVPVTFTLSAGIQLGSYAITNVAFFDGGTMIGQATDATYTAQSPYLDHGLHLISAQALDQFGLNALRPHPPCMCSGPTRRTCCVPIISAIRAWPAWPP